MNRLQLKSLGLTVLDIVHYFLELALCVSIEVVLQVPSLAHDHPNLLDLLLPLLLLLLGDSLELWLDLVSNAFPRVLVGISLLVLLCLDLLNDGHQLLDLHSIELVLVGLGCNCGKGLAKDHLSLWLSWFERGNLNLSLRFLDALFFLGLLLLFLFLVDLFFLLFLLSFLIF